MTMPPDPFRPPEDPPPFPAPPPGGYPPPYGQALPYGGYPPPYAQAPYGGYPAPRSTNGYAIASMVLGIVWVYWIGSILALVFGYIARNQIRQQGQNGDGMAIAGIVLGWVGVATFLFYLAVFILVFPV